jgi:hypothetical protein
MKPSFPLSPLHMTEVAQSSPAPPRPTFGFLLGGTTLGIFFGLILLCAGAGPPSLVLILLAILGAITGGIIESLWPKSLRAPGKLPSGTRKYNDISVSPFRDNPGTTAPRDKPTPPKRNHECHRCGEVFEPSPVICPMCGHSEERRLK